MPVEQGRARVRLPDQPGLYTLTYDDANPTEKVLSVNPSPKESELAYVNSPEAVNLWRFNQPEVGKRTGLVAQATPSLRGVLQQRLWWWMVLAAVVALMLEIGWAEGKREYK